MFLLSLMCIQSGQRGSTGQTILPPHVSLSSEKIESAGIYLMDEGSQLLMWIGREVPAELLRDLFNVESIDQIDPSLV